jgi:hypothetical protein
MPARSRLLAALLLASVPLGAQSIARECRASSVIGRAPSAFDPAWHAGHPDSSYAGMVPRIVADEWLFLADSVLRDFDRDSTSLPDGVRETLRGQLDSVRREMETLTRRGELDDARALAQGVKGDRFRDVTMPGGRVQLFAAFGTPLSLEDTWTTEQRRAVCGRTIAMRRLLTAWGELARHDALQSLRESAARWDNFAEHGYFMYPWELLINSARFDPRSDDPPRTQWVVGHPAVGLEFIDSRIRGLENLQVLQTLTVELGMLRYSDDRAQYRGATAFMAIPSDAVAGVGLMLHVNRQLKAGYIWRAKDAAGERQNGFLVSADIAQMLASAPKKLRDAQDALRQRIEAVKQDVVRGAVPR